MAVAPAASRGAAGRPERLVVLDGIRGWAALQVVVFHMLRECFSRLLPELHTRPVLLLLDGSIAVYTFFVLSGCALSYGYVVRRDTMVVRSLAVKRYLRLAIPIAISSAFTLALVLAGLTANRAAGVIVHREDWLGSFLSDPVSIGHSLCFVAVEVFSFAPIQGSLNPFLWTMSIEMFGAFVVFFVLLVGHGAGLVARMALLALSAVVILLIDERAIGFPVGVVLAEMIAAGWFAALRGRPAWSWPIAAAGLLVAEETMRHTSGPVASTWAALCLLVAVLSNAVLFEFFASRVSQWLGSISFPLYLGQFAVLVTVTSRMIVLWVDPAAPGHVVPYAIAAASVLGSITLAVGLRWAEQRAAWVNVALARVLLR